MNTVRIGFLAALLLAGPVFASPMVEMTCTACRDIQSHPEDVRNFAYNQLHGPHSWMNFDQADRFIVNDTFGNTVTVDMNMEYKAFDIAFRGLQFEFITKLILQIRVIYPNGDVVDYTFDITDMPLDDTLPVGEDNARGDPEDPLPGDGGGGDGGGEGSDDDPPDQDDPPEDPDLPDGTVTIEDPPFDPWEEHCEEC